MREETKSIDYAMEAASGPHFSGLRLDVLRSSPSSSPRSNPIQAISSSTTSLPTSQPFIIGVSGGTASGKTTVCDMIIQQLHDHRVVLVNQDSFYRGLTPEESKRVHEYNFDHPDAFDTEQLLECVEKLKLGQSVHVPIYDFKIHRKSEDSFRQVNVSDVIILEGILVFHDQRVRNLMNMKIFVDTVTFKDLSEHNISESLKMANQREVDNAGNSLHQREEMLSTPEFLEPRRPSYLRKSIAWDNAFFSSDGVLDPEELSAMNNGFKGSETSFSPGIPEDLKMRRSVDSDLTFESLESDSFSLESDAFSLESFDGNLFEDVRASIHRSCGPLKLTSASCDSIIGKAASSDVPGNFSSSNFILRRKTSRQGEISSTAKSNCLLKPYDHCTRCSCSQSLCR